MLCIVNGSPVAATRQGACGFGVESLAGWKNACDTVVAAFLDVNPDRYRDAFHTKARSPFLITTLCGDQQGEIRWSAATDKFTSLLSFAAVWRTDDLPVIWFFAYDDEIGEKMEIC